ncbi:hypothetical protein RIF29_24168 [Crotalaria pallida]|uniref:Uncharacterized protein n=1 Tax=Crotalaria pallida TaxID=3830 RepID=A0AAN9EJA0_CROPI
MDEWKRSGQIPAFGNWDYANELPITQYFECARQAGLVRYSSSSGDSGPYTNTMRVDHDHDLYAVQVKKPSKKGMKNNNNNRERRSSHHYHQGNGKVCDVTEHPRKHHHQMSNSNSNSNSKQLLHKHDVVPRSAPHNHHIKPKPKPVDEDLYKIPPELLRTTKRVGPSSNFL